VLIDSRVGLIWRRWGREKNQYGDTKGLPDAVCVVHVARLLSAVEESSDEGVVTTDGGCKGAGAEWDAAAGMSHDLAQ
jgi:hypothetical protein